MSDDAGSPADAPEPTRAGGYTEEHARAGLDAELPAIDTFPNQFPGYTVRIDYPEFTSICPKTGLPDAGNLIIEYEPDGACMELKSLKLYLVAYRNLGIFQENIVNRVLRDVVAACAPVWCTVKGEFAARGGMYTVVEARFGGGELRAGQGGLGESAPAPAPPSWV